MKTHGSALYHIIFSLQYKYVEERARAPLVDFNVRLLQNIDSIFVNIPKTDFAENIYWVNSVVLKNKKLKATEVMKKLSSRGIGTRPFFFPMHLQPVFVKMGLFDGESYPVSENIASQGFYLPSGLGLDINDISYITDNLKEVLNEYE